MPKEANINLKEDCLMQSQQARSKQTFLRNEFDAFGKWNMPIIRKTELDLVGVNLISYTDIKLTILTRTNKGEFISILMTTVWKACITTLQSLYIG